MQHGKTSGYDDVYNKDDKPSINLGHITLKYCGEKGHYDGSIYWSVQVQIWKGRLSLYRVSNVFELDKKSTNGSGGAEALVNAEGK